MVVRQGWPGGPPGPGNPRQRSTRGHGRIPVAHHTGVWTERISIQGLPSRNIATQNSPLIPSR